MAPLLLPLAGSGQEATPGIGSGTDPNLFRAIRQTERKTVRAETGDRLSRWLSRYRIVATLNPGEVLRTAERGAGDAGDAFSFPTVDGTLELTFVNTTGQRLDELFFRLYPNDFRFDEGGLTIRDVRVDETPVTPSFSIADTVARVPLPEPLAPAASTTIRLGFTATVATTFDFFSSLYNADPIAETIGLNHWHPILAAWDPMTGWGLDPPTAFGDLAFANVALYDVSITAPPEAMLATTGVLIDEAETREGVSRRYVSGPARQFALVAASGYASISREVGGTTVTASFAPGHEIGGQRLLDHAAEALSIFDDLFGAFPYAELDLVELPLGAATGAEFPHVVVLDPSLFEADPAVLAEIGLTERLVEFIVAQGVANQWWYGVVGTNPYAHPFLDEAVAEYSAALYVERRYGEQERDRVLDLADRVLYASAVLVGGDQPVDQPSDAFLDSGAYFGMVYAKGALALHALREEIGDEAFLTGLREYGAAHRFVIAQPSDLRRAFEDAANRDLSAFWEAWFESANTRVAIELTTEISEDAGS